LVSNLNKALDDFILVPNLEESMSVDNPALFSNGLPKETAEINAIWFGR